MKLFTAQQRAKLLVNGRRREVDGSYDPFPVAHLFLINNWRWLISDVCPEDPDKAYALVDIGNAPELGYVSLSELGSIQYGAFSVERDLAFVAKKSMSAYLEEWDSAYWAKRSAAKRSAAT
ncbi:MAG: DUF2958 domain-containing protein [Hyphomonadaceae bacterium]|nr:DUF2958 domain-containing protein [Hyphomonadaceae bacterium]